MKVWSLVRRPKLKSLLKVSYFAFCSALNFWRCNFNFFKVFLDLCVKYFCQLYLNDHNFQDKMIIFKNYLVAFVINIPKGPPKHSKQSLWTLIYIFLFTALPATARLPCIIISSLQVYSIFFLTHILYIKNRN